MSESSDGRAVIVPHTRGDKTVVGPVPGGTNATRVNGELGAAPIVVALRPGQLNAEAQAAQQE